MHEAYEIFSLVKLTEQIESIAAYDDNLIVATRQGHLMMYLVTESNDNTYKIQVLRYHKTFSKKPIQQIDVVPEFNILLCLSDNILVIHDINVIHFPVIQSLQKTKGATLFAVSNETSICTNGIKTPVVRIAVAVKRKIQLFFWKNKEFVELGEDITISDIPKVMAWGQNVICVGFKDEYTFYNIFTGALKDKFSASSSRSMEPCIIKLSDTSFILGRDNSSVIVDESQPTVLSDLIMKVHEPLVAGAWDDPYMLGLLSDKIVVHTIEPPSYIQTLSELSRARLLYRSQKGLLYAASVSQVWRIGAVDVTIQRQLLLKQKKFELAIKLTNMSAETEEEKTTTVEKIQILRALDFFDNKEYAESMKYFTVLKRNPSEVIKLFPEIDDIEQSPNDSPVFSNPTDKESRLLALIDYLKDARKTIKHHNLIGVHAKDITQPKNPLELIDTTLLKCYLQTNDACIGPLLRLNYCKLSEAEALLIKYRKYSDLITLYQANNEHVKALQFMKEQAIQHDSSLKGYDRTINYLQHLGSEHMNLIFEYSSWVLDEYPEEGIKIFTDDILEVENFPRAKVLDFLLREHESLVIPYLEHIIYVWDDSNGLFHNAFIRIVRQKITEKKCTDEQLQELKSKLLVFLDKSNYYSPEMVLVHFPSDGMYEERAIVLGKLDAHEQALTIYIYILGDIQRAIQYAEKAYTKADNNGKNKEVYIILIRLLVNPNHDILKNGPLWNAPKHPNGIKPHIDTVLLLLQNHPDKIDPLKVLHILPDSIPVINLKTFLEVALQKQIDRRRKIQIMGGLLYAENLEVQEMKMNYQKQSVVIDDFNVCPVCKKRFCNQSAFVRYANGVTVHYSCQDKKSN